MAVCLEAVHLTTLSVTPVTFGARLAYHPSRVNQEPLKSLVIPQQSQWHHQFHQHSIAGCHPISGLYHLIYICPLDLPLGPTTSQPTTLVPRRHRRFSCVAHPQRRAPNAQVPWTLRGRPSPSDREGSASSKALWRKASPWGALVKGWIS